MTAGGGLAAGGGVKAGGGVVVGGAGVVVGGVPGDCAATLANTIIRKKTEKTNFRPIIVSFG